MTVASLKKETVFLGGEWNALVLCFLKVSSSYRSSQRTGFIKEGVLKTFAKFRQLRATASALIFLKKHQEK